MLGSILCCIRLHRPEMYQLGKLALCRVVWCLLLHVSTIFLTVWLLQDVCSLYVQHCTSIFDSGGSAFSRLPQYHPVQGRFVAWAAHTSGTASSQAV